MISSRLFRRNSKCFCWLTLYSAINWRHRTRFISPNREQRLAPD